MKALITGASSGLGWDMAHILSEMGYDIIAVARRVEKLEKLRSQLKTNVEILCCDVTDINQCMLICEKAYETDILINNAGFGVFGDFCSTDLNAELKMLDTNIRAVHIITKHFLKIFKEKNSGYILNVASLAAFFPGPLFGSYYATKSYVLRLSQAISTELKHSNSNVSISVLCPGPVHTGFASIAKVNFGTGLERGSKYIVLQSRDVAKYAIEQMFKRKTVIIPGTLLKIAASLRRFLPDTILSKIVYTIQSKKCTIK